MNKLILSALAVAAMVSCSKTDNQGETPDVNSSKIEFGSAITATTKTPGEAQFSQDDQIQVYGFTADAAGKTVDFTAAALISGAYKYDVPSNKFVAVGASANWVGGEFHNFYAFYPQTLTPTLAADGATIAITVPTTGYAHDLLGAFAENAVACVATPAAGKESKLVFEHRLSKVKFEIKRLPSATINNTLSDMKFTMGNSVGTYNVANGVVTNTLPATPVTFTNTLGTAMTIEEQAQPIPGEWIVLPGDNLSEMTFTIGATDYTAKNLINAKTEAGKITTITITYVGEVITFSSEIKPWGHIAGSGDLE